MCIASFIVAHYADDIKVGNDLAAPTHTIMLVIAGAYDRVLSQIDSRSWQIGRAFGRFMLVCHSLSIAIAFATIQVVE